MTQYQQESSGGLCDDCAYYSQIMPSVTQTAQAFAAFDGIVFPPTPVAAVTSGPPKPSKTTTTKTTATTTTPKPAAKQVSSETATQGVSGTQSATTADQGAFQGATAATATTTTTTKPAAKPKPKPAAKPKAKGAGTGAVRAAVSGTLVEAKQAPKLVTVAGQKPGGLTAQDEAALVLGGLLAGARAGWLLPAGHEVKYGTSAKCGVERLGLVPVLRIPNAPRLPPRG
ncbi:MAG: hypothetical protein ACLP22_04685 [Solirubrobacteraceae bacterium]